jgi:hypothetical protein
VSAVSRDSRICRAICDCPASAGTAIQWLRSFWRATACSLPGAKYPPTCSRTGSPAQARQRVRQRKVPAFGWTPVAIPHRGRDPPAPSHLDHWLVYRLTRLTILSRRIRYSSKPGSDGGASVDKPSVTEKLAASARGADRGRVEHLTAPRFAMRCGSSSLFGHRCVRGHEKASMPRMAAGRPIPGCRIAAAARR